jgi:hypothetical protein
VYVHFDGPLAKLVASIDPEASDYMEKSGRIYVKLNRAPYGCVQSSKLWFELLSKVLTGYGMTPNAHDACVFNKVGEKGDQITVAFHVDDLLITSGDSAEIDGLIGHLKTSFEKISVNMTNVHSYLSMTISESSESIAVNMLGYVVKCLLEKTVRGANSPANDRLFEIWTAQPLEKVASESFHSDVAKLLYLAKRTRMDNLTAVSFLASRVSEPTGNDLDKLNRIFGYLFKTKNQEVVFKREVPVSMEAYVDASFGCHHDATSRTGVVLMMSECCSGWME